MDSNNPRVGIVMGSDSDWPLVKKACDTLDSFGVPYETRVISAHRTPDVALDYAQIKSDPWLLTLPFPQPLLETLSQEAYIDGLELAPIVMPVHLIVQLHQSRQLCATSWFFHIHWVPKVSQIHRL